MNSPLLFTPNNSVGFKTIYTFKITFPFSSCSKQVVCNQSIVSYRQSAIRAQYPAGNLQLEHSILQVVCNQSIVSKVVCNQSIVSKVVCNYSIVSCRQSAIRAYYPTVSLQLEHYNLQVVCNQSIVYQVVCNQSIVSYIQSAIRAVCNQSAVSCR